jgi:hypothetical protein
VPYWYYKVVYSHFNGEVYSPALPEIESAIHYLPVHQRKVTRTTLSKALGVGDVIRKRNLQRLLDS